MMQDVFFITYDEPLRDKAWEKIKSQIPYAKRVHGLKGFDAAYKACAESSRSHRFFTIDGDNELNPSFFELDISHQEIPTNAVLSWSAKNIVNGLSYGNGGVKNWPKDVTQNMRTHESAETENGAVDFCFQLNYLQMPGTLSCAKINGSALQAFRSGFREGVKMLLEKGARPPFECSEPKNEIIKKHIWHENLNRLKIWCCVGADVEFGLWSAYGASLGAQMLCLSDWNYQLIRDYDWFDTFWKEEFKLSAPHLEKKIQELHATLNSELDFGLNLLSAEASKFFKSVYVNPPRAGFMYK